MKKAIAELRKQSKQNQLARKLLLKIRRRVESEKQELILEREERLKSEERRLILEREERIESEEFIKEIHDKYEMNKEELTIVNKRKLFSRIKTGITAEKKEELLREMASEGHVNIVKYLLDNNTKINAKNPQKVTALHLAAYRGHKNVVDLLLIRGADKKLKDKRGLEASDYAANYPEITEMLSPEPPESSQQVAVCAESPESSQQVAACTKPPNIGDLTTMQLLNPKYLARGTLDPKYFNAENAYALSHTITGPTRGS